MTFNHHPFILPNATLEAALALGLPWFGAAQAPSPTPSSSNTVTVAGKSVVGDPAAGRDGFDRNCAACHNRDGQSYIAQIPRLSGQVPTYFAGRMEKFRAGEGHPPMVMVSRGISDQAIANIAVYLAAAPLPAPYPVTNASLRARGQQVYAEHCQGCHRPLGTGGGADGQAPRVAGQIPYYTQDQLEYYRSLDPAGLRGPLGGMVKAVHSISEDEQLAVVEYLSTLK